jgi:Uma2 family endonuclease
VVEVAETSLQKDRGIKTALYATAAVSEFWLVNLVDRVVEVHRRPVAGRYMDVHHVDGRGELAPAAFPDLSIAVADLLA